MKKFILSIMFVSLFFVGLGVIVDRVGARFKSDEKALDIIKKARTAIGGDAALAEVRSLVIKGQTNRTVNLDGSDRTEQGETEIVFQYPDKLSRIIKIGDGEAGEAHVQKQFDVMVVGQAESGKMVLEGKDGEIVTPEGKTFTVRTADGTANGETKVFIRKQAGDKAEWNTEDDEVKELNTADGKKIIVRKTADGNAAFTAEDGKNVHVRKIHPGEPHGGMRQNELLRTTLSLLLTAPEGMDVSYTFAGESDIDGTAVNAVVALFGGASYKLYFDRSSNLPVGMSYSGHAPMVVKFRHKAEAGAETTKDVVVFDRKMKEAGDEVENFVRFSDYRNTNGVQLPYKWTTSVAGKTSEVFDVTSYDVNPANIADRFKNEKIFVRTAKPVQN
ncbi:MAG TPA: hypothetical protein VK612_07135 [Pyrinomonadaceae bacterium]|nr:hypothetical protein [Pyrinomonadaceae bacterium]